MTPKLADGLLFSSPSRAALGIVLLNTATWNADWASCLGGEMVHVYRQRGFRAAVLGTVACMSLATASPAATIVTYTYTGAGASPNNWADSNNWASTTGLYPGYIHSIPGSQGGTFSGYIGDEPGIGSAEKITVLPVLIGTSSKGKKTFVCGGQYGQEIL